MGAGHDHGHGGDARVSRMVIAAAILTVFFAVELGTALADRKSTRLNSSHMSISYAVFCLKKNIDSIGNSSCIVPFRPPTITMTAIQTWHCGSAVAGIFASRSVVQELFFSISFGSLAEHME